MNDRLVPAPTPAEEDPVLHGYLSALPGFAPSGGLRDRVLTHVWAPLPQWVRQAQDRWVVLVESGRVWYVIGAIAAGSLIPLGVITGLLIAFSSQIAVLSTWMIARFGPELSGLVAIYWAAATQSVTSWWAANAPPNVGLWVAGVAGLSTVSAIGLLVTLRRGN